MSDIQKGVRYLFLTRLQLVMAVAGVGLVVLFLGWNLVVAPRVIANVLREREYEALEISRAKLGERLGALESRLVEMEGVGQRLNRDVNKIYLAYGLTNDVSIGQGGYPIPATPAPESIYRQKISRVAGLEARLREQVGVLEAFVTEIQAYEVAHRDQVRSTPSIIPLKGDDFVLTSPYGYRTSPFTKKRDFHAGIDLAAPLGTPIHAPADGQVVFSGLYPSRQSMSWHRYGNLISIRHSAEFVTLFGHCDEIKVRAGQKVRQGDVIGTVGNTGWSTSPHLHYEVWRQRDGESHPVNPRIYILDHRWADEERLLIQARRAPEPRDFEPLPRRISR